MSYRSDVSVAFYTLDMQRLPLAALKLWFDENYPKQEAIDEWGAKLDEGDDYLLLNYTGVKWWDGADHVTAVHKALGRFTETFEAEGIDRNENPVLAAYDLVRIGEEDEDIETRHSAWTDFRVGVRREIVFY